MDKENDSMVRIENLKYDYERETEEGVETVNAIRDVSFQIKKGSFTAIIGKNGSGKSTLAKNINALYFPVEGRVYVAEMDTLDENLIWDIRKTAGMVFQNPDNQLVASIVEDDVAFGPENLGVAPEEIRERVDSVLKSVGMYGYRDKAPHFLSGGQKQRVAIAGVLAMEPECIIFDEPTAMLDPSGRREVMNIIQKLNAEGKTVILITHFMEEAALADCIIIMDDGDVVMEGVPEEIFDRSSEIYDLNLDLPMAVQVAEGLRKRGIEVPKDVITEEKLVEFICQYR